MISSFISLSLLFLFLPCPSLSSPLLSLLSLFSLSLGEDTKRPTRVDVLNTNTIKRQARAAGLGGSVGWTSDWRPGSSGFDPRLGRQHSVMEIDHEIFSTVILSLPPIQEGQLSVSGKGMCIILVNNLED